MPLYEYRCIACGSVHEEFRPIKDREYPAPCLECDGSSRYIISTPRISLDGTSGDFPTAADKWAKMHIEGTKIARRKSGEYD